MPESILANAAANQQKTLEEEMLQGKTQAVWSTWRSSESVGHVSTTCCIFNLSVHRSTIAWVVKERTDVFL
jgi:hypothetical protein